MQRSPQISLRTPEGHSEIRASAINKGVDRNFYKIYSKLAEDFGFSEKT
jgi:hypothetical protein